MPLVVLLMEAMTRPGKRSSRVERQRRSVIRLRRNGVRPMRLLDLVVEELSVIVPCQATLFDSLAVKFVLDPFLSRYFMRIRIGPKRSYSLLGLQTA